jgi:hypothetical protein
MSGEPPPRILHRALTRRVANEIREMVPSPRFET